MENKEKQDSNSPLAAKAVFATILATILSNYTWEYIKPLKSRDEKEVIIIQTPKVPASSSMFSREQEGANDIITKNDTVTKSSIPLTAKQQEGFAPSTPGLVPTSNDSSTRQHVFSQMSTYSEAESKSLIENKPILLLCTAEWDNRSSELENELQNDQRFLSIIRHRVVPFKIVTKTGQSRHELLDKFTVTSFPYILMINSQGKVIGRIKGEKGSDEIIKIIQSQL